MQYGEKNALLNDGPLDGVGAVRRGAASSIQAQDKKNDAAHIFTLPGYLPSHHNDDQANSGDALSHWITTTHSQVSKHDRPRAIMKLAQRDRGPEQSPANQRRKETTHKHPKR